MNEFSDLEADLKQLRPAAPSADLSARLARALEQAPVVSGRRIWGAQAASLQFAAACREHLRALRARSTHPFGKLPNGAGWQPALPRRLNWFTLGLGVAAAAFFVLARPNADRVPAKPSSIAAFRAASADPTVRQPVQGMVPDGVTRVVYNTRDEGLHFPGNSDQPVRRKRAHSRETLQWKDSQTGASLRVSYPTEEVELIPVSGQ